MWVTVAAILMVGCGGGGQGENNGEVDAAVGSADAAATALVFRLSYAPQNPQPGDSIFVQLECSQAWVRVTDSSGNPVRIDADCGFCSCDSCNPCAVCDCAFLIEPVEAGTSRDHPFDGVVYPTIQTTECGTCQTAETLEPGTYTARFCYLREENAGATECGEESFVFPPPPGTVVEHVVAD